MSHLRTTLACASLACVALAGSGISAADRASAQNAISHQSASAININSLSTTTGDNTRRGLWCAIGDTPTAAEVDAAPKSYGVVILNPWEVWAMKRIKVLDPTVVVLMYKDLSSSRSYSGRYDQADP